MNNDKGNENKPYEQDPNPKGKDDKGHNGANGNHGNLIKPPKAHSLICELK